MKHLWDTSVLSPHFFSRFVQKGGLRLKLVGSTLVVIFVSILALSFTLISLMKTALEQKAVEVATTSIERIADFSYHALLERSYENRLALGEMLNEIRLAKTEGILDVSIYEHHKTEQISSLEYLAGFGSGKGGVSLDDQKALLFALEKTTSNAVMRKHDLFVAGTEQFNAYRFAKPIRYTFQGENILLGVAVLYYDKEAITGAVWHATYVAIGATLLILLLTALLGYIGGLRFSRPILSIAQAATDVSKGNLNVQVNISSNDEIGELANRFNSMVKELKQRDKMQKFISNSTFAMIKEDAKESLTLGGEYRTLTFLFSDIRNFTALSETKKPEEVVGIINFYLNIQSEVIKAHGGDIDKFIGDEIMVSFAGENSLDKAIHCAIAIQKRIAKENIAREKNKETVCQVGIGIHHGEVVVGNIGSHDRMDFTSIGSAVNLASRLCVHATAGQILIEKSTAHMAQQRFNTQSQAPLAAKGFDRPIDVVSILAEGN